MSLNLQRLRDCAQYHEQMSTTLADAARASRMPKANPMSRNAMAHSAWARELRELHAQRVREMGAAAMPAARRFGVRPVFAWFDMWVGAYWDRGGRRLYILPLPCFGIVVQFADPAPKKILPVRP